MTVTWVAASLSAARHGARLGRRDGGGAGRGDPAGQPGPADRRPRLPGAVLDRRRGADRPGARRRRRGDLVVLPPAASSGPRRGRWPAAATCATWSGGARSAARCSCGPHCSRPPRVAGPRAGPPPAAGPAGPGDAAGSARPPRRVRQRGRRGPGDRRAAVEQDLRPGGARGAVRGRAGGDHLEQGRRLHPHRRAARPARAGVRAGPAADLRRRADLVVEPAGRHQGYGRRAVPGHALLPDRRRRARAGRPVLHQGRRTADRAAVRRGRAQRRHPARRPGLAGHPQRSSRSGCCAGPGCPRSPAACRAPSRRRPTSAAASTRPRSPRWAAWSPRRSCATSPRPTPG